MQRFDSRPVMGLMALLLLALGLRVINLTGRTLWYDEAFAVLFAEKGWDAMVDGTLTKVEGGAADVHPLLYYQSLKYWMDLFGQSVAAVRLYSVLIGVATVGVVFLLTRDWFGQQTAWVAAFITAVAPFHVQYSQESRMYALLALILMLTTWVYWRAWHCHHPGYWVAFGILAGVSMYVQQLAALYLVALGLLPLLAFDRARMIRTAFFSLVSFVIYLPWMLNLPEQMGKLRQYWVQKPTVLHLWLVLRSFVSVNLDFSPRWLLPTFLLAAVLAVLLLYAAFRTLQRIRDETERQPLVWVLWLAFVPMIGMWLVSHLLQPVFLPRALLPSALCFYVGLAWWFTRSGVPRAIALVVGMAWGVVMIFGLVTHYSWDTFPNAPFDDAVEYVAAQVQPSDVVIHGNKISALPMVYYDRELPQRYVRDIPGSGSDTLAVPTQQALGLLADECVAAAAAGAPRVWYVTFAQLEDEMNELIEDDPLNVRYDSLRWLRAHYAVSQVKTFNDLEVYLFTEPDDEASEFKCEVD